MEIKLVLALIATVIGLVGFIPYFHGIFTHKTKPHTYTWLIWAMTQGVAVAAIWVGGGSFGAVSLTIGEIFVLLIFLLSFKYGVNNITKKDKVVLLIALLAIVIWVFTKNPLYSVLLVSGIDLVGYVPTFRKSYHDPWSEKTISWFMFAVTHILNILALEQYSVITSTYLVTLLMANSSLFVFLIVRRRMLNEKSNKL
jgi:hypothetical protein